MVSTHLKNISQFGSFLHHLVIDQEANKVHDIASTSLLFSARVSTLGLLFKQSPGRGQWVLKRFGSSKKIRCFNDGDLWIYELVRLLKLQPKSGCLMGNIIEIPSWKLTKPLKKQSWRWCSLSKGGIWTRSLVFPCLCLFMWSDHWVSKATSNYGSCHDTADGRNPAPVDMENIPFL